MAPPLAAALAMVLAACAPAPNRVEAERYDAFWLWAGVAPQPVLERAREVYVLAGEIRARDPDRVVDLRAGTPRVATASLWIVYRTEIVPWGPRVTPHILRELAAWRGAGNRVAGVQIDFDAATHRIGRYAAFLRDLRRALPRDAKLSVTGLLDGPANADPAALAALGATIDEIVVQTYQGRATVPGCERYLAGLDRLRTPFKVGLVQGGAWREPSGLAANPRFRGYVVFLVNQEAP